MTVMLKQICLVQHNKNSQKSHHIPIRIEFIIKVIHLLNKKYAYAPSHNNTLKFKLMRVRTHVSNNSFVFIKIESLFPKLQRCNVSPFFKICVPSRRRVTSRCSGRRVYAKKFDLLSGLHLIFKVFVVVFVFL